MTGPGGYDETHDVTRSSLDQTSASIEVSGLEPGSYTVHENAKAGWASRGLRSSDLSLLFCAGTAFTNTPPIGIAISEDEQLRWRVGDRQREINPRSTPRRDEMGLPLRWRRDHVDTLPLGLHLPQVGSASPSTSSGVRSTAPDSRHATWTSADLTGSDNLFTYTATVDGGAPAGPSNFPRLRRQPRHRWDLRRLDLIRRHAAKCDDRQVEQRRRSDGDAVAQQVALQARGDRQRRSAHDVVVPTYAACWRRLQAAGTLSSATASGEAADGHNPDSGRSGRLTPARHRFTSMTGRREATRPQPASSRNVGCVAASDDEVNDETNPICSDSTIEVQPPKIQITQVRERRR